MSEDILHKLLADNGFVIDPTSYMRNTHYDIINTNISEFEPTITSISVGHYGYRKYFVYIIFSLEIYHKYNFGVDLSMDLSNYNKSYHSGCEIYAIFDNEDDLIKELCRLNSIKPNIKKAVIYKN